jgi:glycosyltransferase involved in cell wall biosynthesis
VVAGDGPLRPYYERRAGGDPDIIFVGRVFEERAGYYAHSDVYACPSTKASFGITLLEAMACGTPIVCSDADGFRDVVVDGREALIVPKRDPDALASALVRLLEDDALRARLGSEGRQRAMQYHWSRVAGQVLDVYAQLLGLRAAA